MPRLDPHPPLASGRVKPKPFLKWAGGKRRLLPALLERLPARFGAYHECFLGGGALFFELAASRGGAVDYFLSDVNEPLIDAYFGLRNAVGKVIAHLHAHAATHQHSGRREHYYRVRDLDPAALKRAERTARLIFLNKTCYNGLYRENRSGRFNVPFGRYENPRICNERDLRAAARALRLAQVERRDFRSIVARARRGDLVYFDPPYQPLSTTSSFTSYDRNGFGESDQEELRDIFRALDRKGVRVMLSNSKTNFVKKLYAGYGQETVLAPRAINSNASRRGKVGELIIRNYGS